MVKELKTVEQNPKKNPKLTELTTPESVNEIKEFLSDVAFYVFDSTNIGLAEDAVRHNTNNILTKLSKGYPKIQKLLTEPTSYVERFVSMIPFKDIKSNIPANFSPGELYGVINNSLNTAITPETITGGLGAQLKQVKDASSTLGSGREGLISAWENLVNRWYASAVKNTYDVLGDENPDLEEAIDRVQSVPKVGKADDKEFGVASSTFSYMANHLIRLIRLPKMKALIREELDNAINPEGETSTLDERIGSSYEQQTQTGADAEHRLA
jgi:hypothetical protein